MMAGIKKTDNQDYYDYAETHDSPSVAIEATTL